MVMDPRRRRPDEEQAQGGGIAGPNITPGMMMPYFQGSPNYDYSGIQGQGGLAAFRQAQAQNPGRGFGPAGRHLRNVGQPVDFPGMDNQMDIGAPGAPIGGPNVAPGNPQGLAIGQSGALPPGLARQQAGLQNTQGWRNLAPGYAIAAGAGFGTPEGMFGRGMGAAPAPGGPGVRQQGGGGPGGARPGMERAVGATADAPGPGASKAGFGGPAQGSGGPPGAGSGGPPGGGGARQTQGSVRGGSQNTGGVGGKDHSQSDRARGAQRGPQTKSSSAGSAGTSASTARNRMGPSGGGAPASGGTGTSASTNRRVGGPTAQTPPPVSHFAPDPRGSGTAPIGRKKSSTGGGGGGRPTRGGLAARRA